MTERDVYASIRAVFGRYKAEWLSEDLFPLFRQPQYFPELEEPRPTVLVGGRGTGKTTALKCLSYEGNFHLAGGQAGAALDATYVGLYWCIDANRATAFDGTELDDRVWQRLFAHYANLEIVDQMCRYVRWFQQVTDREIRVHPEKVERVAASLNLESTTDLTVLSARIDAAIVRLEASVNSVADGNLGPLSLPGAPIEYMAEALASDQNLASKVFYILIDEFENLTASQQVVLNSMVKHGRERHRFKLGVKDGGWKTHEILTPGEPLVHPADYDLIDLSERFADGAYARFAAEVCNARLSRVSQAHEDLSDRVAIEDAFESLSAEEEARLLGIERRVAHYRRETELTESAQTLIDGLTDLELYYVANRAAARDVPLEKELEEYGRNEDKYLKNYRENYRSSLLYRVSEQSGRGIQKYYAGWETLVRLSGGNIRYLVEIVERSFAKHGLAGRPVKEPIAARLQTEACIDVGQKYTQEVQSLDPAGAQLTYLLLGLGRFFQLLARHSAGHQPDTTSFTIGSSNNGEVDQGVHTLVQRAVMHQILRRRPATKFTSEIDAKEPEYSVHPVFAAFFVFPYQKKRRIRLRADQLDLLSKDLRKGLRGLLEDRRDVGLEGDQLPEQLSLFEPAYG